MRTRGTPPPLVINKIDPIFVKTRHPLRISKVFIILKKRFLTNGGGFLKVEFRDKDLELCAMDEAYAIRRMGKKRAKCYRTRINALVTVANFADLSKYPGHFHELVGNRKGQWACDLDQPYRLIIWGAEPNKAVIWAEVTEAEVVEIVDYHK